MRFDAEDGKGVNTREPVVEVITGHATCLGQKLAYRMDRCHKHVRLRKM
jgi:hypothetical protein